MPASSGTASEEETVRKKVSRICQNFLRELFVEIVWSLFWELVSEWVGVRCGMEASGTISENLIYLQLKAAKWEHQVKKW